MTLRLELSDASSDLSTWLASWKSAFSYNSNGFFNGSLGNAGQWWAGHATYSDGDNNHESSVILNGTDFDYTAPGAFTGHPTSLDLGTNLWQDVSHDLFKQDTQLGITVEGGGDLPITDSFRYAIYGLSHAGQYDGYQPPSGPAFLGLTDYFAEQGTHQIGTAGDDILLSFAGNDTLTGNGHTVDRDVFSWDPKYYNTDSTQPGSGWGHDEITDFHHGTDLIDLSGFGWADEIDFQAHGGSLLGNTITYVDSAHGITSTIQADISGAGSLSWSDVLFA
jgi:hypothetical protein